jgi:hypothetical protein
MQVSRAGIAEALTQSISSAQYNIVQAQRDLQRLSDHARGREMTGDELYHQGYANGRIAELGSKVELLQLLLKAVLG